MQILWQAVKLLGGLLMALTIVEGCSNSSTQQSPPPANRSTSDIHLSRSTTEKLFPQTKNSQELKPSPAESKPLTPLPSPVHKSPSPAIEKQVPLSDIHQEVFGAKTGWNRNLRVNNVAYDLYIPPNYKIDHLLPCILVLPGWNFSRTSWIQNSNLVDYANRYGYILILPEMGKTLYESAYYPETSIKWNSLPGGYFIKNQFIPAIQKRHNLLKPGQYNTLLGLSTGGRGVALIALENPGLFLAGASLSGDFSQENTPSDRLMKAVYGDYNKFPQRWLGQDNPQSRVAEWTMPLYLAHGTADTVVPESQSRLFYQTLIQYHGNTLAIEYHPIKRAKHDYQFWGGKLSYVFQFFETIEQRLKNEL